MADEPKTDFVDDALSETASVVRPDADGVTPIMVVGRRASSSVEISARARALEANLLHSFIPFEDQEGNYSFAQTNADFAAVGIDKDVLELALREHEQERGPR